MSILFNQKSFMIMLIIIIIFLLLQDCLWYPMYLIMWIPIILSFAVAFKNRIYFQMRFSVDNSDLTLFNTLKRVSFQEHISSMIKIFSI